MEYLGSDLSRCARALVTIIESRKEPALAFDLQRDLGEGYAFDDVKSALIELQDRGLVVGTMGGFWRYCAITSESGSTTVRP